jgi:site-specific recombinase XerD
LSGRDRRLNGGGRFIGEPVVSAWRRRKYPEKTSEALSERMIWHIVLKYARETGLVDKLANDLRRTCAKLCRASGWDLEQIQFLLGHASIQTTGTLSGIAAEFQGSDQRSAGASC